jgi:hypothetical protein
LGFTVPLPIQKSAPKIASLPIQKSTAKSFAAVNSKIGSRTTMMSIQKSTAKNMPLLIQKLAVMVKSFRLFFYLFLCVYNVNALK